MDPESWQKLESLFLAALDLEPDQRAAFLDQACAEDAALREEVLAMLDVHTRTTNARAADALLSGAATEESLVGRRIGVYRIDEQIGRGGMGEVYRAQRADQEYRQDVALKLVRAGLGGAEIVQRFRMERQILALLVHPNIAALLDGGVTPDGRPYLVMQYVRGLPITQYAEQHKLSIAERLRLFRTVCEAVQFAHANLVVHRDLKPSNILVTEEGQVRLLDFGIAKLLDPSSTDVTAALTGDLRLLTPEHAAPEQILGKPITTATDVYALGVLLYQLLTGELPFRASTPIELQRVVTEQEARAPSALLSDTQPALLKQVRGDLDHIVLMALRKEPERRYASAGQLAEDVTRHLEGRPVIARPDSVRYRVRKFVQRNRVLVTAAAVIALLLLGGSGALAWQSRQRAFALEQAEQERDKARRLSDFLIGVFRVNDPSESRGRTVTARELLDRGAEQIRFELRDQPLQQAELSTVIGQAYNALGLYKPGTTMLQTALDRIRPNVRPNDPQLAAGLEEMARGVFNEGRLDEGLKMAEEALRIRELQPERTAELAGALDVLGRIHNQMSHYDSAASIYRRAIAMQRAVRPPNDRMLARMLGMYGTVVLNEDSPNVALSIYQEAVAVSERAVGKDHPFVFENYEAVALALSYMNQVDSAVAIHRRLLANRERIFGPDHPNTSFSVYNLARELRTQGKFDESKALYRRAIKMREATYGPMHANVAYAVQGLAMATAMSGDLDGAIEGFERALQILETVFGPRHGDTVAALENLAVLSAARGKKDEAIGWLQLAYDRGLRNSKRVGEQTLGKLKGDPRFDRLVALINPSPPKQ